MNWRQLLLNGWSRAFLLCVVLFLCVTKSNAQTGCDCPAINTCVACAGGLKYLLMDYTGGGIIVSVSASDNGGGLTASLLSGTITINSRVAGQPFDGNVTVSVLYISLPFNLLDTEVINTSCTPPVYVGQQFGNFTMLNGSSMAGALCCAPVDTDHTPPVFNTVCPSNIQRFTDPGTCTATATWTPPTATDNCGTAVNISSTHNPGATFALGNTTVTYTAKDDYDNTITCSFNVEVIDNINPQINNCPANFNETLNASCQFPIPDYRGLITTSDYCDTNVAVSQSPAIGTILSGAETTQLITLTATDDTGNTANCAFTITLKDTTLPQINNCPADFDVSVNATCQFTLPDYRGLITTTDNCGVTVTQLPAIGSTINNAGTVQLITLTATDGSGNSANCTFNITLKDNTDPQITNCPSDADAFVDTNCQFIVPDYTSSLITTDNCDTNVAVTQSPVAGTVLNGVGSVYLITLTATDDAGNTLDCAFNITLKDNVAPQITGCPADFDVDTGASCEFLIPDYTGLITATDYCDSNVAITQLPAVGTILSGVSSTQIITLTATDDSGNASNCSFTISLKDNIDPVITNCPGNSDVFVDTSCQFLIPDYAASLVTTDNCDTNVSVVQSPVAGTIISGDGTTQLISLTATDDSGNTRNCSFSITLKDNTAPQITNCPSDADVFVDTNCQFIVPDYVASLITTDNCDTNVSVTQSPVAGTVLSSVGAIQLITLTATDDAGNTANCTFNITVKDNVAPQITGCPADFDVNTTSSCEFVIPDYTGLITATDYCDSNVIVTQSPVVGTILNGVSSTQLITLTATDDSGNATNCSFTITLKDNLNPQITNCPVDFDVNVSSSCEFVLPDYTTLIVATDNCDTNVTVTQSPVTGTLLTGNGTTQLITLTATDDVGNTATCNFTITLKDTTVPQITNCPIDGDVFVDTNCQFIVPDYAASLTTTDNCDTNVAVTQSPVAGTVLSSVGAIQLITLTATDDAGNTANCTFNITVKDNGAPQITGCPADFDVNTGTSCDFVIPDYTGLITATDHCDSNVTVTQSPVVGTVLNGVSSTQVITLTATDDSGNATNCSFIITLKDDLDPQITNCPINSDVFADASCQFVIPDYAASLTTNDNCDTNVSVVQSPVAGTIISGNGTTQLISLTATDDSGNTSNCSFSITLKDNTAPQITGCPADFDETVTAACEFAVPDYTGLISSNDNCDSNVTITQSPAIGTILNGSTGTQLITLIATDDSGNTTNCSFTITLKDNTDPVITNCPADFDENLNVSCQFALPNYASLITISDNCDTNVSIVQSPVAGTVLNGAGTTQLITLTATDDTGNTTNCSFTITLKDNTDPVIANCPVDFNENLNASCEFTLPDYRTLITATDNCDASVTITQLPAIGTVMSNHNTTQLITLTATDDFGNSSVCTFTITLKDNLAPQITGCPVNFDQNVNASCGFTLPDYTSVITSTDNCDANVTVTQSPGAGTILTGAGTAQLITLTATDDAGNTTNCSFTITLKDNIAPQITSCPADFNENVNSTCQFVVPDYSGRIIATDNCDSNITIAQVPAIGTILNGSGTTQLITLTATDDSGLSANCSFTITLKDITAPVITSCPSNISVNATTGCSAVVTWTPPTASDNCGTPTLNSNHISGDSFPVGITTVTYTAQDSQGNSTTCSFTVEVKDVTPPTIIGCVASDIIVSLTGASCSTIATWTAPTATDNCSTATLTSNHTPGGAFPAGITIVTYTATDAAGNTSTCSFNVVVEDTTAPVLTCPADITVSTGNSCDAIVSWTAPSVTDCSVVTLTSSLPSGSVFAIGTTSVTYTATDANGNSSTCTFNVIVEDKTKPAFSNCPSNITASTNESCKAIINWTAPTATDNCGNATVTSSHTPGSSFDVGTTTVIYTATDAKGNSSQCQFNIIVTDGNAPTISGCPSNIEVKADESGQARITWDEPIASVACGTVSMTSSHSPGDKFDVGSTEVKYTATTSGGVTLTCQFTVNVSYEEIDFIVSKLVTPNGDGVNDLWKIENIESFRDNNITVIDRWGGIIYTASGYDNQNVVWDGMNLKGGKVPTGTYFYTISVRFRGKQVDKKGFIELVRQ